MKLEVRNLSFAYDDVKGKKKTLDNINITLNDNEYTAIIGHTGSGKSTLIQMLNGLLKPDEGEVLCDGKNIFEKGFDLRRHRCDVGLVFQYPEYQLFEETVLKDVCFGPKNKGLSNDAAMEAAVKALELVGIKEKYFERSPFELSGGQKRRVAMAGVLAMNPRLLVLDEPTAGLDPSSKTRIMGLIENLCRKEHVGVVLVSHSMEDVAKYADRIIVMNKGSVMYDDVPKEVFKNRATLKKIGLGVPKIASVMQKLKEMGVNVNPEIFTPDEAAEEILRLYNETIKNE